MKHSIQVVAGRTGLSPDVIRAWERRYGAVDPDRSPTQRRLYSDEDVERLILLRRATMAGRRIGEVAGLPLEELTALVREDAEAMARVPANRGAAETGRSPQDYLDSCMQSAMRMDAAALESALGRAATELGITELFDGVLTPLLEGIGDAWLRGSLSIAHEHMATALVRSQLEAMRAAFSNPYSKSTLIAATPSGEMHELGALKVAVLAAVDGWRSVYLGPNLPASEIADAAAELGARVVALSVVYLEHDPQVETELRRVAELLPKGSALIVGGKASSHYASLQSRSGTLMPEDMGQLRGQLAHLR